jgi:hypothetical protein
VQAAISILAIAATAGSTGNGGVRRSGTTEFRQTHTPFLSNVTEDSQAPKKLRSGKKDACFLKAMKMHCVCVSSLRNVAMLNQQQLLHFSIVLRAECGTPSLVSHTITLPPCPLVMCQKRSIGGHFDQKFPKS